MFPLVRKTDGLKSLFSFALIVVLPLVVVSVYYLVLATPVYQTTARIAVRKESASSESSIALSVGASSALSTFADSFIVTEYVASREVVESLMKSVDLEALMAKGGIDPLYTLPGAPSIEDLVSFWQKMVSANFDVTTGIVTIDVRAFSPDDALRISGAMSELLERLVARLSEKSRTETVRFAQAGVDEAVKEVEVRGEEMRKFRSQNSLVDPRSEVESLNAQIAGLAQERVRLQTELAVVRKLAPDNVAQLQVLDIKIEEIKSEVSKIRGQLRQSGTRTTSLPQLLLDHERLEGHIKIANERYVTALQRLSEANAIAALRGSHLFTFVNFSRPQAPFRPTLPDDILWVIAACLGLWGIIRLAT